MKLLLPIIFSSVALATTTIQTLGTTSTQAVVRVTTNQTGACTIQVSTSPDFSSLVYDINPSLFTGSDACDREHNITDIGGFTLVVGHRGQAYIASDGKRYSRALQCNTVYYIKISIGADVVTGSFTTRNIPTGDNWNDPLPVAKESGHNGEYAWPNLSQTDRNAEVIDPQTGLLLKRISMPTDIVSTTPTNLFTEARGTWVNPDNALVNDTLSATISGSQDVLFLYAKIPNDATSVGCLNCSTSGSSINYLQLPTLNAWYESGSGADLDIQLALTIDGVTPITPWVNQTLAVCTSGCTVGNQYTIGNTTPILDFWTGGKNPGINGFDIGVHSGNANVVGPVVTATSGTFNTRWGAGSKITIGGVQYTIASIDSETQLTLTISPGDASGVAWSASNFGILIRKNTASADTLDVQFANWQWQQGFALTWEATGAQTYASNCSTQLVAGPGGEMGYHCVAGTGTQAILTWIGDTTGTVSVIGPTKFPALAGDDGWDAFFPSPGVFWDKNDGNTLYTTVASHLGPTIIAKAVYTGDNSSTGFFTHNAATLPLCGAPPCFTISDITPPSTGNSLTEKLQAFSPDYASWAQAGQIAFIDFAASNIEFQIKVASAPSNNFNCMWTLYNPTTNNFIAAIPSWKYWPNRWGTCHGTQNINSLNYFRLATGGYNFGTWSGADSNGRGPFRALITSGAVTTTGMACPVVLDLRVPNPPTGNNCLQITLDGAPCDPTPGPNEPADGGTHCGNPADFYLQDLAPGDVGCIVNNPTNRTNSANLNGCDNYYELTANDLTGAEFFRVLVVSGNTITLQRGWYGPSSTVPWLDKDAGASFVTISSSCNFPFPFACPGANSYWPFIADPFGNLSLTTVDYNDNGTSHAVQAPGMQVGSGNDPCPTTDGLSNGCYNTRVGQFPAYFTAPNVPASQNPSMNGFVGEGQPNNVDSHPSYTQFYSATGQELTWVVDGRPFLGDTSLITGTRTNISGNLWKWSSTSFARLRPRILPTMAFGGQSPLLDISGPSSTITGTAVDSYKRCQALLINECVAGSSVGDVYVNIPQASQVINTTTPCLYQGIGGSNITTRGLCISDMGSRQQAITQTSWTAPDIIGSTSRVLTHGLSHWQVTDQFWNAKTTPDGKWAMWPTWNADGLRNDILLAKIPPFPSPTSRPGVTYLPVTVQVAPTTDTIGIRFGYTENENTGTTPQGFCTTRQEACYTTTESTVPFRWASETQHWYTCTSGCSISVPAIANRVLYVAVDRNNGSIIPGTFNPIAVP